MLKRFFSLIVVLFLAFTLYKTDVINFSSLIVDRSDEIAEAELLKREQKALADKKQSSAKRNENNKGEAGKKHGGSFFDGGDGTTIIGEILGRDDSGKKENRDNTASGSDSSSSASNSNKLDQQARDSDKHSSDKNEKTYKLEEAIVKRVVDGDTIIVTMKGGAEERVRLLLIDTPESVHPDGKNELFGIESSDYAKEYLLAGDKILLEIGEEERDKYDRLLAHVWVNGTNFNKHMVEIGYARVAYVYEPNTKYIDEFRQAEEKAKSLGLNIWSIKGYVTDKGFDMSVIK